MSCPLPKDHRSGRIFTSVQLSAAIGITAFAIVSAGPLRSEQAAAPAAGDASTLRICAAAKELPYSASDKSGFENKIAETLATAMGRKVEFVWSDKAAIYAVRDQLDKKLCDVVIGVDTGDERVLTSRAYYRAPYVFVQRKDSPLKIVDWDSPDLAKAHPIGFVQGSPAEVMITKLDLYNDNINYVSSLTNFKDKRNAYTRIPPERMVGEVADKTAALAVAFAPEVARYVKANDALKMVVIPDNNVRSDGLRVPHHFDQSFAVRKDDKDLLAAIDAALPKAQAQIETILKDEGVPYVPPTPRT
ncbi:methanol oxidation system protein MoxJ [Hyphomicrobium sp.]|uniref:methanol oxidation system protein MoxJ n=1 Tax=Hyphomicrobium sp. TaxID=82 RepID=UPI000FC1B5B0|nr:methanol oxidation system protein MoxJ [Hyphomicrobium sp.]RUP11219.1 MAG: methanol oxidation system protein MoxJ [Hyphomicrobium sp.]